MSITTINLIPPRIKKEQRLRQISKVVFSFFFALLLMSVLVYGAIFMANYYTLEELNSEKGELAEYEVKTKKLEPLEKDVALINSRLNKISELRKNSILWSEFLEIFNNSIPTELNIDSLSVDYQAKTINMAGSAETRREIVKLETKLNTMESLSEVGFSSSTYDETDLNYKFSMTGVFK